MQQPNRVKFMNQKQKHFYITKLPQEAIALLFCLLSGEIEECKDIYMIEIKLDKPLDYIKNGGDGILIHTNVNQERNAAQNLFNPDWVVIHKRDFDDIQEHDKHNLKRIAKDYVNRN